MSMIPETPGAGDRAGTGAGAGGDAGVRGRVLSAGVGPVLAAVAAAGVSVPGALMLSMPVPVAVIAAGLILGTGVLTGVGLGTGAPPRGLLVSYSGHTGTVAEAEGDPEGPGFGPEDLYEDYRSGGEDR